jgi:hypothetical protein
MKYPNKIYLHDGQTETTWSTSQEAGGVGYVHWSHAKQVADALQKMVDEAGHLAGFSEHTGKEVISALDNFKKLGL